MPEHLPPMDAELAELLEAVANRDLTPDRQQRLAERLAADSAARAAFIQATALDVMLAHEFPAAQQLVASSALQLPGVEQPPPGPQQITSGVRAKSTFSLIAWLSIAASILLLMTFWPWLSAPTPVAALVSSENAAWESALPTTPGAALVPGRLKLKSGIATVRFNSGAEVILEAPAQLEVISPMRGKLIDGAAVINVPESAIGFVIETPDGYAIDYGTRFAVQVDPAANRSDFELIEGEIAVHHPGTGREVRLTEPHKTVSVREDSVHIVDLENQSKSPDAAGEVVRIGTAGRATSVIRNNKRHKYLAPETLAVKTTENGKWDHRSFFEFDLSKLDVSRIKAARLRLNLVPSQRGFASRLPVVNRFGVYGLTNADKADWVMDSLWEDAPTPQDGRLLGTFEVLRSQQRGNFGIGGADLVRFLQEFPGQAVTLILVRETTQVEGERPGLTHMFASDVHPEVVGPLLEITLE